MKLKKYLKNVAALFVLGSLLLSSSSANAWWFFLYLPGSVTGRIADAVTGAEGENCVGPSAKVGDSVMSSGAFMTIRSLSGTSSRCTNPESPIRALLEPPTQKTTQARIELPDGWEPQPLSDGLKVNGVVLLAVNRTTGGSLMLTTAKRSGISDMMAFAKKRKELQTMRVPAIHQTEIAQLMVSGLPAWRFESTAKMPIGTTATRIVTIVESAQEVIITNISTSADEFGEQKESLLRIVDSLTGLPPPSSQNVVASPPAAR